MLGTERLLILRVNGLQGPRRLMSWSWTNVSDGKSSNTVSSRDSLETLFHCLGLGLGLESYCLGLGLEGYSNCLGLGLGLEGYCLGLGLGLEDYCRGLGLGLEGYCLGLGLGLRGYRIVHITDLDSSAYTSLIGV